MVYNKYFIKIPAIILSLVLLIVQIPAVHADDYGVTAVVPYPAPTQAAVITQPANDTTVNNALQTISGSCELLSPQGTVSIWRNGAALGSTICNGTFSLPIMLIQGMNVLIARSASASGLYGPDSAPLTLTLNLPQSMPPATTSFPVTPGQNTIATNQATATGLVVTIAEPFSTLDASKSLSFTLTITGGVQPYSISLNWGDGSDETHAAGKPGDYTFTHTYEANAVYIIRGNVVDAQGSAAQFSHAVVSIKKPSSAGQTTPRKANTHNAPNNHVLLFAILGSAIILLLIGDYRLGWRQSAKHFAAVSKKKRRKMSAARKRKKRKTTRAKK